MNAELTKKSRQLTRLRLKMMSMKGPEKTLGLTAGEQGNDKAAKSKPYCATDNELQRLSNLLLVIQESERQRIAVDLHDGLGQSLTLIRMALENVASLLAANEFSEAADSLQQLKSKVKDVTGELRRIAMDLRPSMLDDLGILATLSWFFRECESTCHSITIEKRILVQESSVPIPLKITIFRILQEAVCNSVKHAKADHIRVGLIKDGDVLHLSIEDNGQGFDAVERENYCSLDQGHGLVSMKERAKFSGGSYRIESAVGLGTRISVSWVCH